MTKCPRCNKFDAIEDEIFGVLPCNVCQADDEKVVLAVQPEFYTISKHNRVTEQRDRHSKDILQPFIGKGEPNPDFARAYPEKAKKYYTQDQLKRL